MSVMRVKIILKEYPVLLALSNCSVKVSYFYAVNSIQSSVSQTLMCTQLGILRTFQLWPRGSGVPALRACFDSKGPGVCRSDELSGGADAPAGELYLE